MKVFVESQKPHQSHPVTQALRSLCSVSILERFVLKRRMDSSSKYLIVYGLQIQFLFVVSIFEIITFHLNPNNRTVTAKQY